MQNKEFSIPAKNKMVILENEVVKTLEEIPPFPGPEQLKALALNKGINGIAEKINELVIDKGWLLSAKIPWIKSVACLELGNRVLDYQGTAVKIESFLDTSDESKNSKYIFTPLYNGDYWDLYDPYPSTGSITIRFCNSVFLYNAIVFIRVAIDPGYDTKYKNLDTPQQEKYLVPHPYENMNYKVWRNVQDEQTILCTGSSQVITLHMGELVWPGETITLTVDNTDTRNWTFYDVKIIELS